MYDKVSLNSEYQLKINELESVNLVVLGKDPYPTDPIGIPFMKGTWSEMDRNSSGFHIFNSIFGGLPSSDKYESPKDYANYLLSQGIVFLNCSYHYLKKEKLSKIKHKNCLDDAGIINIPILLKSQRIILCGKEVSSVMLASSIDNNKFIEAPHPSRLSRTSKKEDWDKIWGHNQLSILIRKN